MQSMGLVFGKTVRIMGPGFIVGFYYLIYMHIDAFLSVIMKILYERLGFRFATLWLFVGFVLGFNVCFNHLLAFLIKANGPKELIKIE